MLELRLLGTFVLAFDGTPAPSARAQVGTLLLALLALKNGKPIEREWLAATLWPDSNDDQARYNLRRNLTDLRRILGPEAVRLHAPTSRTLALDLSQAFCDVLAFDNAIAQKRWHEAITLYTGAFLPIGDAIWILGEREWRNAAYLRALESLATEAMDREHYTESTERLRQVLTCEPSRESAVRALMHALSADGNRAEALLVYRKFRLYLHDRFLGEPHPETIMVYETMRKAMPSPVKPSPMPSGLRRIPLPLTALRGREGELEQIALLLSRYRWLTLVGMGGIGKTRLALEWARQSKVDTCFVDLTSLNNGEFLEEAIRHTLGFPNGSDLASSIGDAEVLIILDNCEHLLESVAAFLQALLPLCPQLRLLATSREPIGGPGEALFRVAPLQEEAAWHLFTERVHASSPNRVLNLELMALCRSLDGWPLALELAAAQVRTLPTDEVIKRVRLIVPGRRNVPDRHRSLQATLDWNWELLGGSERVGICSLCTFAGGWTVETAAAVCSVLPETLAALVDKSFVEFERERYWFREPIREYIAEQWTDIAERDTVRQKHDQYFLQLACSVEPLLDGQGAKQARQRLATEQENLRLVLSNGGAIALELACSLTMYWFQENLAKEGLYWLGKLLPYHDQDDLLRVRGLHAVGVLASAQFDWVTAHHQANEAVRLCRHLQNTVTDAQIDSELLKALSLLGSTLNNIGQNEQARDVYEEVLATHRRNGNGVAEAQTLENLGYAARSLGDLEGAEERLNQALYLYRQQKNEDRAISAMGQLAMVRSGRGDLTGAKELLREVLSGYQRLGQGSSIAWAFCCLGSIERQLKELTVAHEHITEAIELFRDAGNNLFWPLLELGRVVREQGKTAEARDLFQEAKTLAIASGVQSMVAEINVALSTLPE